LCYRGLSPEPSNEGKKIFFHLHNIMGIRIKLLREQPPYVNGKSNIKSENNLEVIAYFK
jgi:hypothetical protein